MGQKFVVRFEGYEADLAASLGMSLNNLIRRLVGETVGTKPIRSSYFRPENANAEHIRATVCRTVAVAMWQLPGTRQSLAQVEEQVARDHGSEISEWIEENKADLAEVVLLRDTGTNRQVR